MSRQLPYRLAVLTVLAAAALLLAMGREPICTCGYVKLWHGVTRSSGNSQHLTDWYTPSHLLHGLVFYAVLHWLLPRMAIGWRLFFATLVEAGWEIAENTDMVIDRYRAVTISLNYYGDAVVNSVADMLAMMLGFWLARVLPVWLSVALFVGTEALTIWFIRDGLILNVLMLLWPVEALRQWQAAG
ncbi:MAG: DUF2585 domain-containing protein [Paracoccus sp. (in: a-proteobacteria)]